MYIHKVKNDAYNFNIGDDNMNENNDLNKKLMDVLGSLDKEKIEQVTRMVQNMSSDDLNNIAKMLGVNNKKK